MADSRQVGRGSQGEQDPWAGRVAIARSGGRSFAYRPGRELVARSSWTRLVSEARSELLAEIGARGPVSEGDDKRAPVRIDGVPDPVAAARMLRDAGLAAQVDHVFFATPGVGGAPVMFGGVGVGSCCGCCPPDIGPPTGAVPAPRTSTIRPAAAPRLPAGDRVCRVVVVDTGLAAVRFLPAGVHATAIGTRDEPDEDDDGHLDAAAGHATFIAAIIEQLAPGATVEVRQVLTTFGDGSDSDVAAALWALVDDPPQVVNLSFAGYSEDDGPPLAVRQAIAALVGRGVVVVAAAGNDATCRPAWPAAIDGVIGVAALDASGPAWFTNHGPWVRACAPGADVVSRFFAVPSHPSPAEQSDVGALGAVVDWATWSGTSFAAPIVAGVIARTVLAGWTPEQATAKVVDDPDRLRLRGVGTVVNERPW